MEEEISEGNEAIREFMGWPMSKIEVHFLGGTKKELHYHFDRDWNLLMVACKKFDRLENRTQKYQQMCDKIDAAVTSYEIILAWKALLRSIKWYNEVQEHGVKRKRRKELSNPREYTT